MPTQFAPRIGAWYKKSAGESFEVVAFDDADETVEIQYFEGEVEELDLDAWHELDIEPIDPPEDWSGPFDDLERDDFGDIDAAVRPEHLTNFLDDLDRED